MKEHLEDAVETLSDIEGLLQEQVAALSLNKLSVISELEYAVRELIIDSPTQLYGLQEILDAVIKDLYHVVDGLNSIEEVARDCRKRLPNV